MRKHRLLETVEKVVERRDTGRKIVTKETQEGCLSFLIIRFWNFFKVSKSSSACRKDFFDKLKQPMRKHRLLLYISVLQCPAGVGTDGLEGLLADVMLHFAGVGLGGLGIDA